MTSVYDRHYRLVLLGLNKILRMLYVTVHELLFLVSFLVNFIVGKIVHLVSPDEEVYNYYNDKRNILNQLFVKRGWGWTTLYIVLFYAAVIAKRKNYRVIPRAVVHYAAATGWWILFTQWCFGLPIMDKIFVWTGGRCVIEKNEGHSFLHLFEADGAGSYGSSGVTSYHCRRLRGSWEGGHDPSGHVFLMIHCCLYLFFEGLPYWNGWTTLKNNTVKLVRNLSVGLVVQYVIDNPHVLLIQLISLWWFMLFMTNIYFHSVFEKLVGLLFGYFGAAVVYYVPKVLRGRKAGVKVE